MRRSWNIAFLLGSGVRWCFALLVMLPLGALIGVGLLAIWLIWLAVSALQGFLLRFEAPARDRRISASGSYRVTTLATLPPSQRRSLTLPARTPRTTRITFATKPRPRRHSLEDLQRSISAMARHGWPKSKVLETLESVGAARVWSERVAREDAALPASPASSERVHLRYRPGDTAFQRYTMPAARIDVYFDKAGRMVSGFAHQDRRM